MRKFLLWLPQFYIIGSMLMSIPAIAEATTLPKEFWDYLEEFGDDKGNVLDPLDYDQILSLKENEESTTLSSTHAGNPDAQSTSSVKHVEMKIEQKSSARASSAAMKGERL